VRGRVGLAVEAAGRVGVVASLVRGMAGVAARARVAVVARVAVGRPAQVPGLERALPVTREYVHPIVQHVHRVDLVTVRVGLGLG
jgi:hypothetical protein